MSHSQCYPFINTPLPYEYSALEPYIDEKTMHLHHDRHLQTYIDRLNAILKDHPRLQSWTLEKLLQNWCILSCDLKVPVRNNAGGVYNHQFFFDSLTPHCPFLPSLHLVQEIHSQFCGFDRFLTLFKESALAVFGSGYAWLVLEKRRLKIITTANQNTPNLQMQTPIFNIDVWEHAYYLKHYNARAAYVDDWFQVLDWKKADERFEGAMM